ncbi:MAG: encapsulin [Rhodobacteraceae bacterium]|nr:encapsulin [Paracoccaceae bacterium]
MSDTLSWNDDQWNKVRQTVHDQALRARVAASFLPLFGPLPNDAQMVPSNKLEYHGPSSGSVGRMGIDDYTSIRLTSLSVNVYLKNAQVADPELTSALIMFRRAANIIARVEDAIIFNGQEDTGRGPKSDAGISIADKVWRVSGGQKTLGLVKEGEDANKQKIEPDDKDSDTGQQVFHAVVNAIQKIEKQGYHGPFACVMSDSLFTAITKPMPTSMILPRDSILPFLDAPLLRSSALPDGMAIVVSLHGAPVEIVVPNDISVRHLQTTPEAEHVFRVQQRFVLRIKEPGAIATIFK